MAGFFAFFKVFSELIDLCKAAFAGYVALKIARETKKREEAYRAFIEAKTKKEAADALDQISRNF
jgi:archaellum biogenesis protein FlaJ (TadC family)